MNRGLKKVRKSIEKRKKTQQPTSASQLPMKKIYSSFPQEEEKHGYYPVMPDSQQSSSQGNHKNKWLSGMLIKGVMAVLLFLGTGLLYQTDYRPLHKPTKWTTTAMTTEFPFARANHWYRQTFGNPFEPQTDKTEQAETDQVDKTLALPVDGKVKESFQANGSGVKIAPHEQSDVSALEDGVVIFSGNKRDTNKTVVIQHTDGSASTYGFLNKIDVHVYQHVNAHEKIGVFKPGQSQQSVFFAIKKNDHYVDPVQVIKVNDAS